MGVRYVRNINFCCKNEQNTTQFELKMLISQTRFFCLKNIKARARARSPYTFVRSPYIYVRARTGSGLEDPKLFETKYGSLCGVTITRH